MKTIIAENKATNETIIEDENGVYLENEEGERTPLSTDELDQTRQNVRDWIFRD